MLEIPKSCSASGSFGLFGNRPMKIAILSYRSDPKVGGQGVYVDYLSSALINAGAQVDVISGPPYPSLSNAAVRLVELPSLNLYAQPHNGHYALRPRHLLSATDTYEYFGHLSGKFVEPYTFGQRAFAYLQRNPGNYDVVIDNQSLATGIIKIGTQLGLPLTAIIHHPITRDLKLALDQAPDDLNRWLVRRWYSFHHMQMDVAQRLPMITCPSDAAKWDIISEFGVEPERIFPIPLGVDQSIFRPYPHVQPKRNRILTTASADIPLKGLPILLEAFDMVLKSNPEAELVVIGKLRNGQARKVLEERNLARHVQFKSDLTRAQLAEEYQTATVAVTPSLYEGFGLPAAEAMSCGTPVIVTDGGALPEVAGDAGIIVRKNDPRALARAMTRILNDPDHRAAIAASCHDHAVKRFNWDRIAPRYLEFFERAITGRC